MSLSRLNNDTCTYKTNLRQSVGVGNYYTGQPRQDCNLCFPEDTSAQLGSQNIGPIQKGISGATSKDVKLIDVSSDLLGITRHASNCPTDKFQKDSKHSKGLKDSKTPTYALDFPPVCRTIRTEDTRLSNPPCTLRGTGINRWEWLCTNPQDNVTMPFDYNISYRTIAKDNHRPHLPTLINQAPLLPPLNASNEMYQSSWMSRESRPGSEPYSFPANHWKHCDDYGPYT